MSVQYGADQPEYDLIVARDHNMMKVSVKGSQDWGWGLTQSYLPKKPKGSVEKTDYHAAIDKWLQKHGRSTVLCFVQFGGVGLSEMPRMYLATPTEVAAQLRNARKGTGDSILQEQWEWKRGKGAGTIDEIPAAWRFSKDRVEELLTSSQVGLKVEGSTS